MDLDAEGHVIGIEVLDASSRIGIQDFANVTIENLPLEMVAEGRGLPSVVFTEL